MFRKGPEGSDFGYTDMPGVHVHLRETRYEFGLFWDHALYIYFGSECCCEKLRSNQIGRTFDRRVLAHCVLSITG
jgi:hypothetical protein